MCGGWPGDTNIGADPMFVRAPDDGGDGLGDGLSTPDIDEGLNDDYGDLQLSIGSPCVNASDPDFVAEPGQTDLDGHARVLCDRVDLRAYESGIGNHDCNQLIDLSDFANRAVCMTGLGGGPSDPACNPCDSDYDGDIDVADYPGFLAVFGR